MKMKILESTSFGARVIECKIEDVVAIQSAFYIEPTTKSNSEFIGYEYPTVKKQGSLIVHLKSGTKIFPASNWQIEF